MALSNIFREPGREITESVVGITMLAAVAVFVVTGPLAVAWYTANSMVAYDPTMPFLCALFLAVLIEMLAAVAVVGLTLLTHAIGECVCDTLDRNGVELRPRRRR